MFAHFNHSQFRRYVLAFGSLFNSVTLSRTDSDNAEVQRMTVPLEYGPKERWLTRLTQDPELLQGVSVILPRMTYEMSTLTYDSSRKLNTLNVMNFPTDELRKRARLYVGVPYTINFNLEIMTKLQQDGLQIVEQILPYFTPDLTLAINAIPELGLVEQIPLTLTGVSHSDTYEGDFEKRRVIIWSLNFDMKVNFYGPRRKQSRIEEIMVDVHNSPINDLLDPPEYFADEEGYGQITQEDDSLLATEDTANTFLSTGHVSRISIVADPDQEPEDGDDIVATTTITQYDGGAADDE